MDIYLPRLIARSCFIWDKVNIEFLPWVEDSSYASSKLKPLITSLKELSIIISLDGLKWYVEGFIAKGPTPSLLVFGS